MQNMLEETIPLRRSPSLHICTSLHLPIVQGLRPLYPGAPSSAPHFWFNKKKLPHSRNMQELDKEKNKTGQTFSHLDVDPIFVGWTSLVFLRWKKGYVMFLDKTSRDSPPRSAHHALEFRVNVWPGGHQCVASSPGQNTGWVFVGGADTSWDILWGVLRVSSQGDIKLLRSVEQLHVSNCCFYCFLAFLTPKNVNEETNI